jgi:hypothetical protein
MSQHTCFSIFRSPSFGPEAGWGCGNSSRLAAFSPVFSSGMKTSSHRKTLGGFLYFADCYYRSSAPRASPRDTRMFAPLSRTNPVL